MNTNIKIKTTNDGIIIIQNKVGFSIKQLACILAFADTIVKTPSSVTCDMISRTEENIVEIRIDDLGVSMYDSID